MCGVAGGWRVRIEPTLAALRHRGPDACGVAELGGSLTLAHTRLAILDLDPRSDQPFRRGGVTLVYNGEVWNWRALRAELEAEGQTFTTQGDTEVVAAVLDCWGWQGLRRLQGMFALAWATSGEEVFLARDRFGEVPLHWSPGAFASELRSLAAAGGDVRQARLMEPGCWLRLRPDGSAQVQRFYFPPCEPAPQSRAQAAQTLRQLVFLGATERAMADVPVCTLLSGGIDSAAVACALRDQVPNLVAYIAVHDPASRDLKEARKVAEHLELELREVAVPAPSAEDLARVVRVIDMPHKAQVEIGHACLHLARRMARDGFKVTYSGEGSDELWASYGFAYHGLQAHGWHEYRRDLFLDQHRKNFARCNKVFMAHGVECRLPFLHTPLVEHALSLPRGAVQDGTGRPKAVLQEAFAGLLPDSTLRRPKLAFQDGAGLKAAAAQAVADPRRFYQHEHERAVRELGTPA